MSYFFFFAGAFFLAAAFFLAGAFFFAVANWLTPFLNDQCREDPTRVLRVVVSISSRSAWCRMESQGPRPLIGRSL